MKVRLFYWIENDSAGSAVVNFTRTLEEAQNREAAAHPEDRMCDVTATSVIVDAGPA